MRRFLPLFFIICAFASFSQTQKIRAYMDTKQFYAPGMGDYVEIQMQFVGYSLKYKGQEGGLIADIAIRMSVNVGDSIVDSDAYRLQSPLMKDSIIEDFYDLKRFALKPGNYTLKIELEDLNAEGVSVKSSLPLIVDVTDKKPFVSDIQFVESAQRGESSSVFYKSGFTIIPRLSSFYPTEISQLPVYMEVYNSDLLKDSIFVVKQTFTDVMTGKELEDLTVYSRHKKSDVVPVLRAIDISALPTGKYSLGIAILTKEMNFVANKSCELERVNDSEFAFDDASILIDPAFQASIAEDSVLFYIASLIPIAGQTEIKSILKIIKAKDKELARKRIQGFWIATSGTNSYEAWSRYKAQVLLVEKLYNNNFQNGYETDRGRVYLKYGPPTQVLQKDVSSNEYPYEIWQYNKIGKTSNKRFVFYNPDLVNNTYRLLHSDMIGEIKNPSWQLILNKRNTTNGDIDDPNKNVQQIWGGNSMNNF